MRSPERRVSELGLLQVRAAKIGVVEFRAPQGHVPPLAATYAIKVALQAVYDGTPPGKVANIADKELMGKFIRKAYYDRWIKEFLGGD